jgi:hypothetical protein
MTILILADFWCDSLVCGSNYLLCEDFILVSIEVVFSIPELLFQTCKRVFNGIVVRRIRGKKLEFAAFIFDNCPEILL